MQVGVVVVGAERAAVGRVTLLDTSAHVGDFSRGEWASEFDDFDEDGEVCAETRDEFFFADDDDEAFGDGSDDFFAGEVSAAALGEVECGIDFVGAVDGDVERVNLIESGQGDADFAGHLFGEEAGGDAESFDFAGGDASAQGADEGECGPAGPKPDTVAVTYKVRGDSADVRKLVR